MLFHDVLWSIWLCRNDIVFNQKLFDISQVFVLIRTQLAWWFKAKWPSSFYSIDNFLKGLLEIKHTFEIRSYQISYKILSRIDSMVRSLENQVLQALVEYSEIDYWKWFNKWKWFSKGSIRWILSKSIGYVYSNFVEFMVFREVFLFFTASEFKNTHRLVIESDSTNVSLIENFVFLPFFLLPRFLSFLFLRPNLATWLHMHNWR